MIKCFTVNQSLRLTEKGDLTLWNRDCGRKPYSRPSGRKYSIVGITAPYFIYSGGSDMSAKVGIVMGSDSDLPVIQKALDTLDSLGISYEVHIYSAHRTPDEAADFASNARKNGFGVIIAAAGMAAHLAGAIASRTTLPVIGIPCKSTNLDGVDALFSTVQMPSGVPVATVGINGGVNAALLAAEILSVCDSALAAKLDAKRESDKAAVLVKDRNLSEKLNNK